MSGLASSPGVGARVSGGICRSGVCALGDVAAGGCCSEVAPCCWLRLLVLHRTSRIEIRSFIGTSFLQLTILVCKTLEFNVTPEFYRIVTISKERTYKKG